MSNWKNSGTRKGTIKLKTLRKPGVKDLSGMFDKAAHICTSPALSALSPSCYGKTDVLISLQLMRSSDMLMRPTLRVS